MAFQIFHPHEQIVTEAKTIQRCPHGIGNDWRPLPLTLRELAMLEMMNLITDKQNWHEKIFDEFIAESWRVEAYTDSLNFGTSITIAAANWCIQELREKATIFKATGCVAVLDNGAKVIKGDAVIDPLLQFELQQACYPLNNVPDTSKDYHPNSNNQVVNLVHPSLYPLVYRESKILDSRLVGVKGCELYTGRGSRVSLPTVDSKFYSKRFQWLPCNVAFDADDEVIIMSYINNLHPSANEYLYSTIEKFIAKAIPLWDMCLVKRYPRKDLRRIQCWEQEWDLPEAMYDDPPPEDFDIESELDAQLVQEIGVARARWVRDRNVIVPDPPDFAAVDSVKPWRTNEFDLRRDFAQRGVQVIVKLASIELTPDNPTYDGGNWHLEGMLNERIAATAIYYYDSHNVTDSELSFRTATDSLDGEDNVEHYNKTIGYDNYDYSGLEEIYGFKLDGSDASVQELGNISTPEGRMIAFPNTLQHRTCPLRLVDENQPGHRRMLVLWLVDPHVTIPSTAHIPPQQRDWWMHRVLKAWPRLQTLPPEVLNLIFGHIHHDPMSIETAKTYRLELMAERSQYADQVEAEYTSSTFSFCEH